MPEKLKKGIVFKLPKKGDLADRNNREIALLWQTSEKALGQVLPLLILYFINLFGSCIYSSPFFCDLSSYFFPCSLAHSFPPEHILSKRYSSWLCL